MSKIVFMICVLAILLVATFCYYLKILNHRDVYSDEFITTVEYMIELDKIYGNECEIDEEELIEFYRRDVLNNMY